MMMLEKQLVTNCGIGNESSIISDLQEAKILMGWDKSITKVKDAPWKNW